MQNDTSNQPNPTLKKPDQASINSAFARKVQYGRIKNLEMCEKIKDYVFENTGLRMMGIDKKGDKGYYDKLVSIDTGEYLQEYEALFDAYYTLRASTNVLLANFKDNGRVRPQIISVKHSRHKLDHIWNMRKSQMIRKVWRELLSKDRLHEQYTPMHMVLTVPHKDGTWMGKKFYGKELIAFFNILRKYPVFKKCVYGGEYGTETTKGEHGLHTHIHALIFQYKHVSTNKFREELSEIWKRLTGGNLFYKTLYVHRKEHGAWITENIPAKVVQGDEEEFTLEEAYDRRKKFYLDNRNPWYKSLSDEEKVEVYNRAILECIKYHFKNESFKDENGEYDIDFIKEILQESKGLRMYSKFGAFYNDKRLNYYNPSPGEDTVEEWQKIDYEMQCYYNEDGELIEPFGGMTDEEILEASIEVLNDPNRLTEEELREIWKKEGNDIDYGQEYPRFEEDIDFEKMEELRSSVDNSLNYLTNPFTGEAAKRDEYELVIAYPEDLKFTINTTTKKCWINYGDPDNYFKLRNNIELKKVMKSLYTNKYYEILEYDDIQRFLRHKTRSAANNLFSNN